VTARAAGQSASVKLYVREAPVTISARPDPIEVVQGDSALVRARVADAKTGSEIAGRLVTGSIAGSHASYSAATGYVVGRTPGEDMLTLRSGDAVAQIVVRVAAKRAPDVAAPTVADLRRIADQVARAVSSKNGRDLAPLVAGGGSPSGTDRAFLEWVRDKRPTAKATGTPRYEARGREHVAQLTVQCRWVSRMVYGVPTTESAEAAFEANLAPADGGWQLHSLRVTRCPGGCR
jgi:hypothetical protein